MTIKRLILFLILVFSVPARAQEVPDMGLYKVRISESDRSITAEIKPVKSEPEIEASRFYNWYSANRIRQTQGGYSGKLLNGLYSEFYLNKNIKEQGSFDRGLKSGTWKSWTEDGILVQILTWSAGIKQGAFYLYDEKGGLKQKGNYKNGLLDGKQYTYAKEQVTVSNYKAGKVLVPDTSRSFWSKINIFKKKKHS